MCTQLDPIQNLNLLFIKPLLQALVHDIQVTGRHHIIPSYRVPTPSAPTDTATRVTPGHARHGRPAYGRAGQPARGPSAATPAPRGPQDSTTSPGAPGRHPDAQIAAKPPVSPGAVRTGHQARDDG